MDPTILWLLVVAACVAVAAAVWYMLGKRRSEQLRQRFGDEYDRAVVST